MCPIPLPRRVAAGLLAAALGCGGDKSTAPNNSGNSGDDDVTPTVQSTDPRADATDVPLRPEISVTFSEAVDPASVTPTSFRLSDGVAATVGVDGRTAVLTPAAPLEPRTRYTATISGVRDLAGNALAAAHSWSFTTAAPVVLAAELPLETGRRWRYQRRDTTKYCAASTGCDRIGFDGETFVYAERAEPWQGRSAWRLSVFDYRLQPGIDPPGFSARVEYVAEDAQGLHRWTPSVESGQWRTIIARPGPTWSEGAFLLLDNPGHGGGMRLTAGTASVPAGAFSTVMVEHEYKETGQYATKDIFDTRREHYSPGVGLVSASWDLTIDDNDPRGTDFWSEGFYALTHATTGPFPELVPEREGSDTTTSAMESAGPTIFAGDASTGDAGSTMRDDAVGCSSECIAPNVRGQKVLEDWYRLTVTARTTMRIELAFPAHDSERNHWNDLDLYVFGATAGGGLVYLARSAGEAGKPEVLAGVVEPGTYYLAVQAWDTAQGARVPYWLSIR